MDDHHAVAVAGGLVVQHFDLHPDLGNAGQMVRWRGMGVGVHPTEPEVKTREPEIGQSRGKASDIQLTGKEEAIINQQTIKRYATLRNESKQEETSIETTPKKE